jgi:outer membrane biosynthesis protein TonB
VPGPVDLLRVAALAVFLALVAVGLWLLDVAWWVIPPVMLVAWLIAATIESMAWRQPRTTHVVQVQGQLPPQPEPLPAPAEPSAAAPTEAIVPPASPPEPAPASPPEEPPQPEPAQRAEPEAEAKPEPAPEPEPQPKPVAVTPPPEEPRRERRRRVRLLPTPAPRQELAREPIPPSVESPVVEFRPRTYAPRQWNLWDLERLAREQTKEHPERRDELAFLFVHLRQFAAADGSLPAEFDPLVRETFGGLLEQPYRA